MKDIGAPLLNVTPLARELEPRLKAAVDAKAKPLGALGRIEALAVHIGLVTQSLKPALGKAALAVFAGDHGIVAEGVTAYPSEVSALIAQMVLDGQAGANIAARAAGAEVFLINAGLRAPLALDDLDGWPRELAASGSVRLGTRNFLREAAMTETALLQALGAGASVASFLKEHGFGVLALGEIGIGNSSAAALIGHAVTGLPLEKLVGNEPARLRAGSNISAMCWPAPMPARPCVEAGTRYVSSAATKWPRWRAPCSKRRASAKFCSWTASSLQRQPARRFRWSLTFENTSSLPIARPRLATLPCLSGSAPSHCSIFKCGLAKARARRWPSRSCAWQRAC